MKSLKLKLFEYRKSLGIEQSEIANIVTEHINLCDQYSEKEIYGNLNTLLETYKFYENVNQFLGSVDQELSKDNLLYTLKDLYAKINRKPDGFLYETALSALTECINQPTEEDRKMRVVSDLKMFEWIPEVKNFLAEMASNPQERNNFISNGGKIDDVYSIVLQIKEGYLTRVAKQWFLMNNEGIASTLLENHVKDDAQLKRLRMIEQAVDIAHFTENSITFKISEELTVSFDTDTKQIRLNEDLADKGTTLETLFNSPLVPFLGTAFYPLLNETYNNLDKFMKIDTVKHVYNVANPAFECYVFNHSGKIAQYRKDSRMGNSYYTFENAMPLIENVMHELGADLTFFYETLLSDELKNRINVEREEKKIVEQLTDTENAIIKIKNEGAEFLNENKVLENLYNQLLSKKHKLSEQLKSVKNRKNNLNK